MSNSANHRKLSPKVITLIIAALSIIITLIALLVAPFPIDFEVSAISAIDNNVIYVDNGTDFPYLYKADSEGGFSGQDLKVVVFSDTHITSSLSDAYSNNRTITMLRKNIEEEQPDFVIFTGDIITGAFTKNRAIDLAEMMEEYNIYWAVVYGNHDTEHFTALSREELTALWSSYAHCLLRKGTTEGYGNYIVNIKTAENTVSESLIFMDSGAYLSEEDMATYNVENGYDYIKPAQIEWYHKSIIELQTTYGENIKSLLFFHIPLPEYEDAYNEGEVLSGNKLEDVSGSIHNSGMFDAIVEEGSTQAIFVGHDHINDYDALYLGVHCIYNQASGYSTYDVVHSLGYSDSERLQGCSVITIHSDGSFDMIKKLNTRFN